MKRMKLWVLGILIGSLGHMQVLLAFEWRRLSNTKDGSKKTLTKCQTLCELEYKRKKIEEQKANDFRKDKRDLITLQI